MHVSRRTSRHLLLGRTACVWQNGGSQSPFQGIILWSGFQLCREDQTNVICMHCPYALRKPLTFSLPLIIPVQTVGVGSRILGPGLSENVTLVYGKDAFAISLFLPPSLLLPLIVLLA